MRRKVALATACLLFCLMFAFLTQKSAGWAYLHHGAMAEDTLRALGWAEEEIVNIPGYVNEVDVSLPHNNGSCHRVEKYQRVFELYGGDICSFMGAEKWASEFVEFAKTAYASGDMELGKKNLGYAIHFIQDAVCPPHVFPFSENWTDMAHWNFEAHALIYGTFGNDWQALVRNASAELITSADDLRQKVEEAADWVNATFQPPRCSYVRQDGAIIGDLSGTVVGWNMTDDDIGRCIERAASLVKGASRWAHPNANLGNIYIRADGSIEPITAAISSIDNVTYTLTDNIGTYGIVIERDNITIDGKGHTIQGTFNPESYRGLDLSFRSNVTIKNARVTGFWQAGIYLWFSSHICILDSDIIDNYSSGISGYQSHFNSISESNLENNSYGIYLYGYHYFNRIFENNITANRAFGLGLDCGSGSGFLNNDVYGNNITANGHVLAGFYGGIVLRGISNDSIHENNIADNWCGICLNTGSNNTIYNNNFKNNTHQIRDVNWDYPSIPPSINAWDVGYPPGGNYWSDYSGTDLHSGPYQNETGSDGIGDTPYIIDQNNTDRYPFMRQDGWLNATQLQFALDPNPAYVGQTVMLLGNLTDRLGQPINNTEIDLFVNDTFAGSLFTNSSGWFQASSKVPAAGTYNITAYYYGSQNCDPSVHSETLTVSQKLNTKVSFTLSPNPAKVGQTVTMLGNLTDNSNNTITGAPLEVYLKIGAGSWQYVATIYTNSTGWFAVSGKVTSTGTYQIAVLYRGSYKYNLSYRIETLTVNP